jgi:putative NADH-flavin reductase
VRTPGDFTFSHPNVKVIKGDVFEPAGFEAAMEGQDAVVSCLGVRNTEPTSLYSEGVRNIIQAMQEKHVSRIVCLSAVAVVVPEKGSFFIRFLTKYILQRIFKYSYADMLRMEKILSESGLTLTVIRPPRLTNGEQTGKYRTAINEPLNGPSKISRADLAAYMVKHLFDKQTFSTIVEISY